MPPRDFYPPEFTARSRAVLSEVREAVPDAVVIGGWGTWVRTQGPMSHDIDLILTRAELEMLRSHVEGMSDSRHLGGRKWRAMLRGIHLDLYLPDESVLGQQLGLKVGALAPHRQTVDGWNVLELPAHICTKLAAVLDRPESLPGEKDRHEIVDLLGLGVDPHRAATVLVESSSRSPDEVSAMVDEAFGYLQDLNLDRKTRARLRNAAKQWRLALQAVAAGDGASDDGQERKVRDKPARRTSPQGVTQEMPNSCR